MLKIISVFIFMIYLSFGQSVLCGKVVDCKGTPIRFVLIKNLSNGDFSISDSGGVYNVKCFLGDTLAFIMLGYKHKIVVVDTLQKVREVVLEEADVKLPDVDIETEYFRKKKEIGYFKRNGVYFFPLGFLKKAFDVKVETYKCFTRICNLWDKPAKIKGVKFRVKRTGTCELYTRLRIKRVDNSGYPGKDMLLQPVNLTFDDFVSPFTYIDLSSYDDLVIREKSCVYVGLEVLGKRGCDFDNNIYIGKFNKKGEVFSYCNVESGEWVEGLTYIYEVDNRTGNRVLKKIIPWGLSVSLEVFYPED